MSRPSSDLDRRAVRAAIRLAAAGGVRSVTFEAVAADVGASKGAVLHYFRTKADLIEAMVATLVADQRGAVEAACAQDPVAVGRFARGLLRVASPHGGGQLERGLLSALLEEPARATAMRDYWRWCQDRLLADGIAPVHAAVIMLASDGLWFAELLGLPVFDARLLQDTVAWLEALTRVPASAGSMP